MTQFLALLVGSILIENVTFYGGMKATPASSGDVINVFYFMGIIVASAVFIFVILFLPIRDVVIKLLEFLATVVASTVVFFVILSIFYVPAADLIALILAIAIYIGRLFFHHIRNLLAILSAAGVAALVGFSLDPFPMLVFIVAIAVYDIIAVWWTGHMVEFAKYFVKTKTAFTISVAGKSEIELKRRGKIIKELVPISMELGTGDLTIPAALAVSVYKFGSLVFPLAVILGGACGLFIILKRAAKEKMIFPAMPSITICSLFALFAVIIMYYIMGKL